MSDLIVTVRKITEILKHDLADNLEIVRMGSWQVVAQKGTCQDGGEVLHIPPDAIIPNDLADKWGVTKYLSTNGRVKAVKLRGAVSYGFIVPNDACFQLEENVAEKLGITKYEPVIPISFSKGQAASQNPFFHNYTDIQNLRNFPDKLDLSKEVVVLEKIHGSSQKTGRIDNVVMVGSHRVQRKIENAGVYDLPLRLYGKEIQQLFGQVAGNIILYGEVYGKKIQDLTYGLAEHDWRLFDISINGEYLSWAEIESLCLRFGIPMVPILYKGLADMPRLERLCSGESVLPLAKHVIEGIVVRPYGSELTWNRGSLDPHPKRMIFKLINPDYLTRKNATEYH